MKTKNGFTLMDKNEIALYLTKQAELGDRVKHLKGGENNE